jgi:hypothetical protein
MPIDYIDNYPFATVVKRIVAVRGDSAEGAAVSVNSPNWFDARRILDLCGQNG